METPKTRIVAALRKLWLWSNERNAALKHYNRECNICGVHESKAKGQEVKIQVHHKDGILNWDTIVKAIREQLLVDVTKLEVLCKDCHDRVTKEQRRTWGR